MTDGENDVGSGWREDGAKCPRPVECISNATLWWVGRNGALEKRLSIRMSSLKRKGLAFL